MFSWCYKLEKCSISRRIFHFLNYVRFKLLSLFNMFSLPSPARFFFLSLNDLNENNNEINVYVRWIRLVYLMPRTNWTVRYPTTERTMNWTWCSRTPSWYCFQIYIHTHAFDFNICHKWNRKIERFGIRMKCNPLSQFHFQFPFESWISWNCNFNRSDFLVYFTMYKMLCGIQLTATICEHWRHWRHYCTSWLH